MRIEEFRPGAVMKSSFVETASGSNNRDLSVDFKADLANAVGASETPAAA
jgi:hypothetical protein